MEASPLTRNQKLVQASLQPAGLHAGWPLAEAALDTGLGKGLSVLPGGAAVDQHLVAHLKLEQPRQPPVGEEAIRVQVARVEKEAGVVGLEELVKVSVVIREPDVASSEAGAVRAPSVKRLDHGWQRVGPASEVWVAVGHALIHSLGQGHLHPADHGLRSVAFVPPGEELDVYASLSAQPSAEVLAKHGRLPVAHKGLDARNDAFVEDLEHRLAPVVRGLALHGKGGQLLRRRFHGHEEALVAPVVLGPLRPVERQVDEDQA